MGTEGYSKVDWQNLQRYIERIERIENVLGSILANETLSSYDDERGRELLGWESP